MANVILLWSDSLLGIKLSKLKSFLKNCSKNFGRFFMIIIIISFFFFFQVAGLIVSYLAVIMSMPK